MDWVVAGTIVTAAATVVLALVTFVLAKETRRLADLTARPHVVANIRSNDWAFSFADLELANTGTATAYDIELAFTPPLKREDEEYGPPLQSVSVLMPGQRISTFLAEFTALVDTTYAVEVSWRPNPSSDKRVHLTYRLNIDWIKGTSRLGSGDPIILIADELKKLREDFGRIASGFKRLRVETFTSEDRKLERETMEQRMRARREQNDESGPET